MHLNVTPKFGDDQRKTSQSARDITQTLKLEVDEASNDLKADRSWEGVGGSTHNPAAHRLASRTIYLHLKQTAKPVSSPKHLKEQVSHFSFSPRHLRLCFNPEVGNGVRKQTHRSSEKDRTGESKGYRTKNACQALQSFECIGSSAQNHAENSNRARTINLNWRTTTNKVESSRNVGGLSKNTETSKTELMDDGSGSTPLNKGVSLHCLLCSDVFTSKDDFARHLQVHVGKPTPPLPVPSDSNEEQYRMDSKDEGQRSTASSCTIKNHNLNSATDSADSFLCKKPQVKRSVPAIAKLQKLHLGIILSLTTSSQMSESIEDKCRRDGKDDGQRSTAFVKHCFKSGCELCKQFSRFMFV